MITLDSCSDEPMIVPSGKECDKDKDYFEILGSKLILTSDGFGIDEYNGFIFEPSDSVYFDSLNSEDFNGFRIEFNVNYLAQENHYRSSFINKAYCDAALCDYGELGSKDDTLEGIEFFTLRNYNDSIVQGDNIDDLLKYVVTGYADSTMSIFEFNKEYSNTRTLSKSYHFKFDELPKKEFLSIKCQMNFNRNRVFTTSLFIKEITK